MLFVFSEILQTCWGDSNDSYNIFSERSLPKGFIYSQSNSHPEFCREFHSAALDKIEATLGS